MEPPVPIASSVVRSLVAAAVLAPSSHNTQPWRFRAAESIIELRADRTRRLPVNDPSDRELVLSCGAALFNLWVAAAAAGYTANVTACPPGEDVDLLAVVGFQQAQNPVHAQLAEALTKRHTHRGRFGPLQPMVPAIESMEDVAMQHDVGLRWVPSGVDRSALADLVAEGDRILFSDARWRRELAKWMRRPRDGEGLTLSWWAAAVTPRVVARFDVGARTAKADAGATLDAPLVGVLSTREDRPAAWLAGGQALEHLLLVAAAQGIQANYANPPCQVPHLRTRLREELKIDGYPQVVLRLGVAPVGRRARRRPLDSVLELA